MIPPRKVLVIEDDRDAAEIICELVVYLGHRVAHAACGERAVPLAESFDPDVILVDLNLPDVDGCIVAQQLRPWAGRRRPAIHALTGWSGADDLARVRAAGFDRHLVKPIGLEELAHLLAPRSVRAFGRRRTDR